MSLQSNISGIYALSLRIWHNMLNYFEEEVSLCIINPPTPPHSDTHIYPQGRIKFFSRVHQQEFNWNCLRTICSNW